jgi:hypothetical protein
MAHGCAASARPAVRTSRRQSARCGAGSARTRSSSPPGSSGAGARLPQRRAHFTDGRCAVIAAARFNRCAAADAGAHGSARAARLGLFTRDQAITATVLAERLAQGGADGWEVRLGAQGQLGWLTAATTARSPLRATQARKGRRRRSGGSRPAAGRSRADQSFPGRCCARRAGRGRRRRLQGLSGRLRRSSRALRRPAPAAPARRPAADGGAAATVPGTDPDPDRASFAPRSTRPVIRPSWPRTSPPMVIA